MVRFGQKMTIISEKSQNWKKCLFVPYSFSSNPYNPYNFQPLMMTCPKILKICQITKFYIGFQKINVTIIRYIALHNASTSL
jgi:hypothetical protein